MKQGPEKSLAWLLWRPSCQAVLLALLLFTPAIGLAFDHTLEEAIVRGDWSDVISALRNNDALANDSVARFVMAHACQATNRNNAALLLLLSLKSSEDFKEWTKWTEDFAHRHAGHSIPLYLRADALWRMGDREGAMDALNRGISDPGTALALHARGILLLEQHQGDAALRDLQEATKRAPDFAQGYVDLGMYWTQRESWSRAQEAFDQALLRNNGLAMAYNGRGTAYFRAGHLENAFDDFATAAQLVPFWLLPQVNKTLTLHAAMYTMTKAGMAEQLGSDHVSDHQYREMLRKQGEKLQSFIRDDTLRRQELAFLPAEDLKQLVQRYGTTQVTLALGYEWHRTHTDIINHILDMNQLFENHALRQSTSAGMTVPETVELAWYASHQNAVHYSGWARYGVADERQTLSERDIAELPQREELLRLGRELSQAGVADFTNEMVAQLLNRGLV